MRSQEERGRENGAPWSALTHRLSLKRADLTTMSVFRIAAESGERMQRGQERNIGQDRKAEQSRAEERTLALPFVLLRVRSSSMFWFLSLSFLSVLFASCPSLSFISSFPSFALLPSCLVIRVPFLPYTASLRDTYLHLLRLEAGVARHEHKLLQFFIHFQFAVIFAGEQKANAENREIMTMLMEKGYTWATLDFLA